MIIHHQGSLFDTDVFWIAHGCNCMGVMGSGVAKIVKEKYPEAFEIYMERISKNKVSDLHPMALLGVVQWFTYKDRGIINIFSQFQYGPPPQKYVSYDALDRAFNELNHTFKGKEIAIPRIGAGLGGGNWNVIEKIIEERTSDIKVHVYTPK